MTNENVVVSTATNTREVLGDFLKKFHLKTPKIWCPSSIYKT